MAVLQVGPNAPLYRTIAAAIAASNPSDTIQIQPGYSNETATVTQANLTFTGAASSTGIVLQLAPGVTTLTLLGTAPINVVDPSGGNTIVGNDGDNVVTVSNGVDAVSGGPGTDRLVIDYSAATGAITGDSTSNFTEAGGGARSVTINGGFENFTVLTGSGADTITTGAGDDIINAGDGANTISAGQGANRIISGGGNDTIVALDGGNFVDAGNGTNTITTGAGNDTILSGTGPDTIVSGAGDDTITVTGGADSVDAGSGTDRLIVNYAASTTSVIVSPLTGSFAAGYSGVVSDTSGNSVTFQNVESFAITGGTGADQLTGGGGNDTLTGGAGNDVLNGGAGFDTAVFSGRRGDYTVTGSAGNYTVVDNRAGSPDGTDTLISIEGFLFANSPPTGAVLISGTPQAGQVLTESNNLADPDGLGPLSYQWQSNGAPIAGATNVTYTLTQAEVGTTVTVVASYTDGQGTAESVASAPTGIIAFDPAVGPPGSPPVTPLTAGTIGVYRFYDANTGSHFITSSLSEKNAVATPGTSAYRPSFVAETNQFGSIDPAVADPNAVAIYRFFDGNTGSHFLTANASERDSVLNPASPNFHASYVFEPNSTFYEHAIRQTGDVAVQRLFDTSTGSHFYASSTAELANLATPQSAAYRPSLVSEGIAFYAPPGAFA